MVSGDFLGSEEFKGVNEVKITYGQVKREVARDCKMRPVDVLKNIFSEVLAEEEICDGSFTDVFNLRVIGVAGLPFYAPISMVMLGIQVVREFCLDCVRQGLSILFVNRNDEMELYFADGQRCWKEKSINEEGKLVCKTVINLIDQVSSWPGEINGCGEHRFDPRVISPGSHYFVNLLLGNRLGYSRPLQTMPKSVVDGLGRGSFRSHAGTQVLASRWDLRPEENGFPANRQFYLMEESKLLFYSANPFDPEVIRVETVHGVDNTVITYDLRSGLRVVREIFLLPQRTGEPLAVEVQRVRLFSSGLGERKIRLIATGMFGSAKARELSVDVIYTTLISQSLILKTDQDGVVAIGADYQSPDLQEDFRFFSMLIHREEEISFPEEFATDYNRFIGGGSLARPEGLGLLDNQLSRRGPDFFALATDFNLTGGTEVIVDCFTGLVSAKGNPNFAGWESYQREIVNLLQVNLNSQVLEQIREEKKAFLEQYRSFIQVNSGDYLADGHFNYNLPFQILYQSFVSRSFAWTQKGYREIGFREIQDIFASMYFFISMGEDDFVKSLLKEWGSMIFELGYAYHNFFWRGKEPGRWSDDALWFVQAVDRYLKLTDDFSFLEEVVPIAETEPIRKRSIYQAVQAVVCYSSRISIGKHGLPLLDYADWNDCLKLDPDHIDGCEKERLYRKQLEKTGASPGEQPFASEYTESVLNGFLLKVALDAVCDWAEVKKDTEYALQMKDWRSELVNNLQRYAWRGDFFARTLFNRPLAGGYSFLGAGGDGLSLDSEIDGTYFLNSFSWSVLAGVATEEQIRIMLNVIIAYLKTPYGLKLCTPVNYGKISDNVPSAQYFLGDRENGGVFKHACMMAVAALLKSAREVKDRELAEQLWALAYEVIDQVRPYHTLKDPYRICGNPRFCTQYNNGETGENMGPILSGTATWFWLSMVSALGIEFTGEGLQLDPILEGKLTRVKVLLRTGSTRYEIEITKPEGFSRIMDQSVEIWLDGAVCQNSKIPLFMDGKIHHVQVRFL